MTGGAADGTAPHPSVGIDDVVHHRARLGVLTVLAQSGTATFGYLRDVLRLTDGNLGRHLTVLAGQGLVEIVKGYQGRRPRTWVDITDAGRRALAVEMAALRAPVDTFDRGTGGAPRS